MPPRNDNKIDLAVIVSGQPTPVTVNANQTISHLIHEALQRSGNTGQDPDQWELRLEGGQLLESGSRVGAAGLVDGMTLFLNPRAGAGG